MVRAGPSAAVLWLPFWGLGLVLLAGCQSESGSGKAAGAGASGAASVGGSPSGGQGGTSPVPMGGNDSMAGSGGGSAGAAGSAVAGSGGSGGGVLEPWVPKFESKSLSSEFLGEGAAIGDIDGDGKVDMWAGPRWYKGPGFELGGNLYTDEVFPITEYSKNFLSFLDDLDGDQDLDAIAYGFPGEDVRWYENPGPQGLAANWAVHPMLETGVGNESPTFVNLVGDSERELVFMTDNRLGYAVRGATPTSAWTFKAIGPDLGMGRYTHGLGVGDLNGDGLNDVVERSGAWLQVAAQAGQDPSWQRHEIDFAPGGTGGAQMLIYDVDGDDDADVVTSLTAHGYGLSWFEQTTSGAELSFVAHEILPSQAAAGNFSQLHALALADLNGDGLGDVITGKRYYAHTPPTDPGGTDPAVLFWFELTRDGGVKFTPHQIHDDSGVGTFFEAGDLNGDAKPDLAITSKKGTFLHLQQ